MTDPEDIKKLYEGKRVVQYDRRISHFNVTKKKAIGRSRLAPGDKVGVFCCGTGLDFPYIQKKIGQEGRIVGVDFSANMLSRAHALVHAKGWSNVELIEHDITRLAGRYDGAFDVAVCTLGLSVIPDFKGAYRSICASVRPGGQVIVGDMQLANGLKAIFNPLSVRLARSFGGSAQGHQNVLEIKDLMRRELTVVAEGEMLLGSYFYVIADKFRT